MPGSQKRRIMADYNVGGILQTFDLRTGRIRSFDGIRANGKPNLGGFILPKFPSPLDAQFQAFAVRT